MNEKGLTQSQLSQQIREGDSLHLSLALKHFTNKGLILQESGLWLPSSETLKRPLALATKVRLLIF